MFAAMVSCSSTDSSDPLASVNKSLHDKHMLKALSGDAEAQADVAYDYKVGSGVGKDIREAEKWYRKAAEQGNTSAQSSLIIMYGMDGELAGEKPEECYYWAQKLYHNPNANDFAKVLSGNFLHRCYDSGYGVEINPEKAAEWKAKYLADYQRDLRNHLKKSTEAGKTASQ